MVWLDVTAPRGWWQEADTYRLTSKQSESTMHTLTKRKLEQSDFYGESIPEDYLKYLNHLITIGDRDGAKAVLPESFLQRRIWKVDYKTLRNIIFQRREHKWKLWHEFCREVHDQVAHPELLPSPFIAKTVHTNA